MKVIHESHSWKSSMKVIHEIHPWKSSMKVIFDMTVHGYAPNTKMSTFKEKTFLWTKRDLTNHCLWDKKCWFHIGLSYFTIYWSESVHTGWHGPVWVCVMRYDQQHQMYGYIWRWLTDWINNHQYLGQAPVQSVNPVCWSCLSWEFLSNCCLWTGI